MNCLMCQDTGYRGFDRCWACRPPERWYFEVVQLPNGKSRKKFTKQVPTDELPKEEEAPNVWPDLGK